MQHHMQQQQPCVRWQRDQSTLSGHCRWAQRSRVHAAASAPVEQQVESDIGHLKLIAEDATKLIGNTPMVSPGHWGRPS